VTADPHHLESTPGLARNVGPAEPVAPQRGTGGADALYDAESVPLLADAHHAMTDAIAERLAVTDPSGDWALTDYLLITLEETRDGARGAMTVIVSSPDLCPARARDLTAHAHQQLAQAAVGHICPSRGEATAPDQATHQP
jgi:hypothetical protein